jgi:hypothetical protein
LFFILKVFFKRINFFILLNYFNELISRIIFKIKYSRNPRETRLVIIMAKLSVREKVTVSREDRTKQKKSPFVSKIQ